MRGRAPEAGSINRNRPVVDWTEVLDVPYTSPKNKPKMPSSWPQYIQGEEIDVDIPREAKIWWATVSQMPHCILWNASDWQYFKSSFFVAVAALNGDTKMFNELRQRESKMGLTAADRIGLRIRYVSPEEEKQVVVNAPIVTNKRRERLLSGE